MADKEDKKAGGDKAPKGGGQSGGDKQPKADKAQQAKGDKGGKGKPDGAPAEKKPRVKEERVTPRMRTPDEVRSRLLS